MVKTSSTIRVTQAKEVEVLRKIIDIVTSELDLDSVLKRTVDIVFEVTRADSIFIYLFDEKKHNLVMRASKVPGAKKPVIKLKTGEGITGWVAKQNKPVRISEKAYEDSRFKTFDLLPQDRYEAFLSVPIVYKSKAIGVINIQHRGAYKHSAGLVQIMNMIAKQVGGVIENARMYEDAKKKVKQFDSLMKVSSSVVSEKYLDEILNLIVVVTAELLNSKICSVMLLDNKGEHLFIKATESLSDYYKEKPPVSVKNSISGDVITTKKPIAVYDVRHNKRYMFKDLAQKEGLSSMLAVPMIMKKKAIGIINVYTKSYHKFTSEEIDVLQMIAHQAAIALEHTKLVEEAVKARDALETRKLVEKAKGILMNTQRLSENEAYKVIHKKSMDTCRSMKEIAEAIILASEIGGVD